MEWIRSFYDPIEEGPLQGLSPFNVMICLYVCPLAILAIYFLDWCEKQRRV